MKISSIRKVALGHKTVSKSCKVIFAKGNTELREGITATFTEHSLSYFPSISSFNPLNHFRQLRHRQTKHPIT